VLQATASPLLSPATALKSDQGGSIAAAPEERAAVPRPRSRCSRCEQEAAQRRPTKYPEYSIVLLGERFAAASFLGD